MVLLLALPYITFADTWVSGHYRSNGTYVEGYYRSSPDGDPYNNYSFPGNTNPYTGKTATGNADTYLKNYYNNSSYSLPSYSSYSSYSLPSTPTCPLNSYYDGISSCKCNYGYVSSGGSCVSGNSVCYAQTGYGSSYDTISKTCKCDYGYVIGDSGKCVSTSNYCSDRLGIMSRYNSLSKSCECMSGYEFNGSSCTYKGSYSSSYTPSFSGSSGFKSITGGYIVDGMTVCFSGYQKDGNSCIKKSQPTASYSSPTSKSPSWFADCGEGYNRYDNRCVAKMENAKYNGSTYTCNEGFRVDSTGAKCIGYDTYCKEKHGLGSSAKNNQCSCNYGYKLDPVTDRCVL